MKPPNARSALLLLLAVLAGCGAASRQKILEALFDGVPPRVIEAPDEGQAIGAKRPAGKSQAPISWSHGPYAAKLCDACHESAASNALVLPRDQICLKCHELQLTKKYVHGPVADGGCMICHDPHKSKYRYMLVSESSSFCLNCHEQQAVARNSAHDGVTEQCTNCHDAHMSDKKYLLLK